MRWKLPSYVASPFRHEDVGYRRGTDPPFSRRSQTAEVPFEFRWLTTACTSTQGTSWRWRKPRTTANSGVKSTPRVVAPTRMQLCSIQWVAVSGSIRTRASRPSEKGSHREVAPSNHEKHDPSTTGLDADLDDRVCCTLLDGHAVPFREGWLLTRGVLVLWSS
jgi:hypothetical protein